MLVVQRLIFTTLSWATLDKVRKLSPSHRSELLATVGVWAHQDSWEYLSETSGIYEQYFFISVLNRNIFSLDNPLQFETGAVWLWSWEETGKLARDCDWHEAQWEWSGCQQWKYQDYWKHSTKSTKKLTMTNSGGVLQNIFEILSMAAIRATQ